MKLITTKDYDSMSKRAATLIASELTINPKLVLGLATGSTVKGLYKYLVSWYKEGYLDFSNIETVNLDEYLGLSPEHEQSYRYFMNHYLFDQTNIDKSKTHVPDGLAINPMKECFRYDKLIENLGGINLQLLGIGHNGHIGFNEPGDAFSKGTSLENLSDLTIKKNSRFFTSIEEVPQRALTMGIQSIMAAEKILLCVSGPDKAPILKETLTGPISPKVPASILQVHRNCTIIADEAALSKM